MDFNGISELIDKVSKSSLSYFEVEEDKIKIVMKKEVKVVKEISIENKVDDLDREPVQYIKQEKVSESLKEIKNIQKHENEETEEGYCVVSPIVGTFYLSGEIGAEPIVKKGDKVKKGDSLCIIEAMKIMNEIESEVDGEILEVLVENETMVEYGQPLFRLKV
ncbi:MAG: acetyl-CoA carboxylase biotin carboxyl carrier protein [Clostridiaceae bacterium]